ncbi:MFS transporter [Sphingorhabdus lutea]|uniref:MFS transporter n=2 Tax=Sphingorhabdus lutea TaxID=1913578 RepID=A0A1L3JEF7_9SPHN|nr:MFS transporter [Sphingorhabdus lutea]APG63528.1 MFS transporter [Sphingorhabdus lutea]
MQKPQNNSPKNAPKIAPKIGSVPNDRLVILFLVMMVAAAGNTAMQATLPAISSTLKISDVWVSMAFSWSALLWVWTAPKWARMSDKRGRKLLMSWGMWGFISSMLLCGVSLWLGLHGWIGAGLTFIIFALFRSLYGGFGSAAPPAVQAYLAARTEAEERSKAMALLASSFGLGTVIGPAVAAYLVFEPFGLAGPLFMFGAFGIAVWAALKLRLPNDTPKFAARGAVASYPSSASVNNAPDGDIDENDNGQSTDRAPLNLRDSKIFKWLLSGLVVGHAQAILLGVIGFLVRDRLHLYDQPAMAVSMIGSVMFIGAIATLLSQWGLIPLLSLSPSVCVRWGSIAAIIGILIIAIGRDFSTISLGYAISSLGFGLTRPGFTAGASLAVDRSYQGDIAGKVASINGAAYIAAPAIGVALYNYYEPASFALMLSGLIFLLLWGWRKLD